MKKVTLLILDGFGINTKTPDENSIIQAKTPTFQKLFSKLITKLEASWRAVWIPEWQIWNSEVGHMTIWAWQVIKQSLVKIWDSFKSGEFENLEVFKESIKNVQKNNSNIHIMWLFWPWWVHAHWSHLEEILSIIPKNIKINLHIFTDWKDLDTRTFLGLFKEFKKNFIDKNENLVVSSISWRYFAMDRDNNWERIKKAYDEIIYWNNITDLSIEEYIEKSYNNDITDEFISPVSFKNWDSVSENDSVFLLNFRSDRAQQMAKVFVDQNFAWFKRKEFKNLYFVTMTKYYDEYNGKYFIETEKIDNCLSKILQDNNITQLHIAETEKFAHVTKFFNWWKQIVFNWEKDILVPSHKVATYDLDPEMSAEEIWQKYSENALDYDFTVLNYANWDMVGHTWSMEASIKSVQKLDEIVAKTIDFCDKNNIDLLITADHWNCEEMWIPENPKTAHTTNVVPFWYIKNGEVVETKKSWWLANVAPTVLEIMGVGKCEEMWESLNLT